MLKVLTPRKNLTIATERRTHRRYAIRTKLEYRLISRRKVIQTGAGHLVNMSRGGLLFACNQGIPPRTRVELEVDWPAHAAKIALHVVGESVRSEGATTAVKILRSAFQFQ